ncbi:hypothetical protein BLOT_009812 [Blomia tropicalis]|nr:hypothetical protein BLOT_009812 [Blomia tropicalis]
MNPIEKCNNGSVPDEKHIMADDDKPVLPLGTICLLCSIPYELAPTFMVTECGHYYCESCLDDMLANFFSCHNERHADDVPLCTLCKEPLFKRLEEPITYPPGNQ